jgi:hypothetical protein
MHYGQDGFISDDETVLDWPASKSGDYRVLRRGKKWMCLQVPPPGYPLDEPGHFDKVFVQWLKDSIASGRSTPRDLVLPICTRVRGFRTSPTRPRKGISRWSPRYGGLSASNGSTWLQPRWVQRLGMCDAFKVGSRKTGAVRERFVLKNVGLFLSFLCQIHCLTK